RTGLRAGRHVGARSGGRGGGGTSRRGGGGWSTGRSSGGSGTGGIGGARRFLAAGPEEGEPENRDQYDEQEHPGPGQDRHCARPLLLRAGLGWTGRVRHVAVAVTGLVGG